LNHFPKLSLPKCWQEFVRFLIKGTFLCGLVMHYVYDR